jgi:adenosine/AMP kinase
MSRKSKRHSRLVPQMEKGSAFQPAAGKKAVRNEFNPDYTYVIQDLRRIGILAGSFFVILVVLSFFLR